jgi:hypothetical protein
MVASAGVATALTVTGRAARDLRAALTEIDRLILDAIWPDDEKSLSESALFALGYPDVHDLELDDQ